MPKMNVSAGCDCSPTNTKRCSRRRNRAERSEKTRLLVGEEALRGVERRAKRRAAARFVACAAEHAARRGGRIRTTKHRDAKRREGDGSGGAGSGSEAETGRGATNTRGATGGKFRRRKPSTPKPLAAECAGLRPDGVYAYAEWSHGRAGRPSGTGRTVTAKLAVR